MIRIRRSFLEDFRRVVATDYGDEAALIETIRGNPQPAKWIMEAGTAFHKLLAGEPVGYERDPEDGNWYVAVPFDETNDTATFSLSDVSQAIGHVGSGLHEVLGRKRITAAGHVVEIEGTADWVWGLALQDHKCKWSTPDARDYENQVQWRCYLWLHDAAVLRYNLFHFKDPDPTGYCALKEIVSFKFWRYPGMEAEIVEWVRRFVEWAEMRGLLKHLDTARIQAM